MFSSVVVVPLYRDYNKQQNSMKDLRNFDQLVSVLQTQPIAIVNPIKKTIRIVLLNYRNGQHLIMVCNLDCLFHRSDKRLVRLATPNQKSYSTKVKNNLMSLWNTKFDLMNRLYN